MVWVTQTPTVTVADRLPSIGLSGGNVPVVSNQRQKWWLMGGVRSDQCIIAYQPIRASSLATSYINLANPGTYNATLGVAPQFDSSAGWIFNAINTYLNTGFKPGLSINRSLIIRFSNAAITGNYCAISAATAANGTFELLGPWAGFSYVYANGPSVVGPRVDGRASGIYAIAGLRGYYNGVYEAAIPSDPPVEVTHDVYIGVRNQIGTKVGYFLGAIQAVAIYNITLTDAQVKAITAAIQCA